MRYEPFFAACRVKLRDMAARFTIPKYSWQPSAYVRPQSHVLLDVNMLRVEK